MRFFRYDYLHSLFSTTQVSVVSELSFYIKPQTEASSLEKFINGMFQRSVEIVNLPDCCRIISKVK